VLDRQPDYAPAYCARAQVFLDQRQLDAAQADCNDAIQLDRRWLPRMCCVVASLRRAAMMIGP
jgi:hypothetical protein